MPMWAWAVPFLIACICQRVPWIAVSLKDLLSPRNPVEIPKTEWVSIAVISEDLSSADMDTLAELYRPKSMSLDEIRIAMSKKGEDQVKTGGSEEMDLGTDSDSDAYATANEDGDEDGDEDAYATANEDGDEDADEDAYATANEDGDEDADEDADADAYAHAYTYANSNTTTVATNWQDAISYREECSAGSEIFLALTPPNLALSTTPRYWNG